MFRSFTWLASIAALTAVPSIAAAQTFSGPRVEAVAGWNHVDGEAQERSGDGVAYGASAGYDLQAGHVVGGALAEITDASGSACTDLLKLGAVQGENCLHNGRGVFAGARLGYVIGEKSLLYVLGGYANVRQRASYTGRPDASTPELQVSRSSSRSRDGYRLGAGIEHAVSGRAFLKVEYRYTDAGDAPSAEQHQVVTGVGIRF